ncbi:MAG: stage II sporulation protein P [Bacillota bacterium]|nr:stage II sporulation protein P [Bacillota bacterium]
MKLRRLKKSKGKYLRGIMKLAIFALLSLLVIKIGAFSGSVISDFDNSFVREIDVQNFKDALNSSLPIFDSVYNSGNISISLYGEVKGLISKIFGFDINSPESVLNSDSVLLSNYYISYYPDMLQKREKQVKLDYSQDDNGDETERRGLLVDESSIYSEDGNNPDNGSKTNENKTDEDKTNNKTNDNKTNDSKTNDNKPNDYGFQSQGKIVIQNETNEKINIESLLDEPITKLSNKKGPKVLIYHTHTTEAYVYKTSDLNKSNTPTWTMDPNKSVVRVGEELSRILRSKYGIDVIHNGTIHDYPNYNGSYGKSLITATSILRSYPSINVVIDLHRDGLGVQGKKLRVVKKINGKNAAQVMFVLGTNKSGLYHPEWKENLKFALKLQERLNVISPGLAKPIDLSKNRYNQQVTNEALIIEVGGDGNLLDECLESTKYIAQAINDVLKK